MQPSREELCEQFALLGDTELLRRFRSGDLTELAEEAAAAELRRRGVPIAETPAWFSAAADAARGADELVLLARVLTPTEAYILQGRLQAEGIPVTVADDQLVQTNALLTLAVGGVRLLVPQSRLQAAREVLAAIARGDYVLDDNAALPEPRET